jgi:prophage regulatory protein
MSDILAPCGDVTLPSPSEASLSHDARPGRLLYCREDLHRRGIKLSNSTLLRLEKKGEFPKRIRLADHSVAWLASEIHAHITALALARGSAT